MAVALEKEVAGNASKTTAASIAATVPAAGCAAGNVLVVLCGWVGSSTGTALSVSDSRGNTYTKLASSVAPLCNIAAFACKLTNALLSGDAITFNIGASNADQAIEVYEFSGADAPSSSAFCNVDNGSGTATDETGGISIPTTDAVVAGVLINGPTGDSLTADSDTNGGVAWTGGTLRGTSGGGATSNVTLRSARKTTLTSLATQEWNPTITSRSWAAIIVRVPAPVVAGSLIYADRRIARNSLLRR